jgi:hypothetical protein
MKGLLPFRSGEVDREGRPIISGGAGALLVVRQGIPEMRSERKTIFDGRRRQARRR